MTSMVLEEPDQLVICYLMLLQSGPPLLGTLVNLLSLPSTSPRHLTGYDRRHCSLNFLPLVSLLLSLLSYLIISQTDPYQLWLMDLSLPLNLSIMVLRRPVFYYLPFSLLSLMICWKLHIILSIHVLMTTLYIFLLYCTKDLLTTPGLSLELMLLLPLMMIWKELPNRGRTIWSVLMT